MIQNVDNADQVNIMVGAFAMILFLILTAGCAITKPSKNSFQTTIKVSELKFRADQSSEFSDLNEDQCHPDSNRVQHTFVLIHGIYGDEDTFDRLPHELLFDEELGRSSVYLMEYWSSKFFPNFQSLSELGQAFKKRIEELVDCKHPENIIIIAHSQGGLIAKEAVLAWKEEGDEKNLLEKTKLILIGTPNSFSTYAAYNNIIVNSIFAPITWGTGLFTAPFGKAFVYNRQAFDMADNIFPIGSGDRPGMFRSRFMLNHVAKWGAYFPSGVMDKDKPETYAIVGVKNLFDHYDLSDGVVHSTTLLFGGIPANRVHHVPYRHFGGEAAVDDKHHRTFELIKKIVIGQSDKRDKTHTADKFAQRLSPFKDLQYSILTFVMEESNPSIQLESIRLETEKPSIRESDIAAEQKQKDKQPMVDIEYYRQGLRKIKRRLDENVSTSFLEFIGLVVAFPFQTLQAVMYPVVNEAETNARKSEPPTWEIKHVPIIVLEGDHDGLIEVRKSQSSGVFGMLGTEKGWVPYTITDKADDLNAACTANFPIIWESSTKSSLPHASYSSKMIKVQPNAVNYIKVELYHDQIKLTRVGCV